MCDVVPEQWFRARAVCPVCGFKQRREHGKATPKGICFTCHSGVLHREVKRALSISDRDEMRAYFVDCDQVYMMRTKIRTPWWRRFFGSPWVGTPVPVVF